LAIIGEGTLQNKAKTSRRGSWPGCGSSEAAVGVAWSAAWSRSGATSHPCA